MADLVLETLVEVVVRSAFCNGLFVVQLDLADEQPGKSTRVVVQLLFVR